MNMRYKTESIQFSFENNAGETLSGRLEKPKTEVRAYALFAHCFTCTKNISAATRISRKLSELGIAVLRFDFTGLGNSDGDFANTNFSSNVEDLICAYQALEKSFEAPKILIGHSFGGAAVLKASTVIDDVKAVVSIAAPSDTSHVAHLFKKNIDEINSEGEACVLLEGREFLIKKQFIDDLNENDLLNGLKDSKKSYLIMHSPFDNIVSIDHAGNIFKSLKHPKSFISLDNIDHLVSKKEDADYIGEQINAWAKRYLDINEVSHNKPKLEGDTQIIVESREGKLFTNNIYSENHTLIADEPESVKGDDLGMSPYELLLSSLGACTSMTMGMYARRKGFNLKSVKVELSHKKDHFDDCKTCNDGPKKLDHIIKKISIDGDLSKEQKEKIYNIAEKCPVNRTLMSEIIIDSKLMD